MTAWAKALGIHIIFASNLFLGESGERLPKYRNIQNPSANIQRNTKLQIPTLPPRLGSWRLNILLRDWGARPPRAQRRTPSSAAASSEARAWKQFLPASAPSRGSLLRRLELGFFITLPAH
jgi:hypothetical protein